MHVDGFGICQFHQIGVADPVLVGIEDGLCLGMVILSHGWLEDRCCAPGLGIDDMGVLHGFSHVVADSEGAVGAFGIVAASCQDLVIELHAFRVSQNNFHTHHAGGDDSTLGNGAGLVHARRVGPTHDELGSFECSHLLFDREDVGQSLEGMVLVALHVQDGDVSPVSEVLD